MREPARVPRVLVAGMGNVLRRDDGFGVEVARRLLSRTLPSGVVVLDAGIAGVRVVQELMDGYDGLIFVDATERGAAPGTLYELVPERRTDPLSPEDAPDSLHMVEPARIMLLARAAGCLPPLVTVIGCEPADYDSLALELHPTVAAAVPGAVALVLARISQWRRMDSARESGVE